MSRAQILMLEPGGWGGICHYAYNLCQALAGREVDITLVTASPYELANRQHDFPVVDRIVHTQSYGSNVRGILETIRGHHNPILHIQATLSARKDWVPLLAAKSVGLPVVTTVHNVQAHDREEREAPGMRAALTAIYQLSSALIVHGASNRSELLDTFTLDASRVHDVPHGDYAFAQEGADWTREAARERLGLAPGIPIAIAFGAVRPYKGFESLIPAFAEVRKTNPEAMLMIVGQPQGLTADDIVRLAETNGIADALYTNLSYVPLEDIPLYFSAADIGVFPYSKVYQSGSIQLAYAFSLPVVVSDVGALGETVSDGVNGHLVPPDDPASLASAIRRLFDLDAAERTVMGNASARLAERWSWGRIAGITEKIYETVL